jgi:type IV secretory pathway VirJ component
MNAMSKWTKSVFVAFGGLATTILAAAGYVGYLSDDPFTVLPAKASSDPLKVVFLSGDMGFNVGMGPRIAQQLNARGVAVLGFNSLTWFRASRSVEEVRQLIPELLDRADAAFGPGPTLVIGQSFGADALQLALAELPAGDRSRIAGAVLIVPTAEIRLRASPDEILNFAPPELPALPTARQLTWLPALCISGREEPRSICRQINADNVELIELPGGHYLGGDAEAVADAIHDWRKAWHPRWSATDK